MPPLPRKAIRLAILDDYQGIGEGHFAKLTEGGWVEVQSFKDTLLPYNGKDTPDGQFFWGRLAFESPFCSSSFFPPRA